MKTPVIVFIIHLFVENVLKSSVANHPDMFAVF